MGYMAMGMAKIERGIPMHDLREFRAVATDICRRRKWPFGLLEVGESFVMTGVSDGSARSQACDYGRRSGRKFSVAKIAGGHRVWRVA
jgi:hypothetical protein